ncbi:MAG: proline dehydrogenase family protein [Firmicutes bacterium]|nr:proline dehydrogenase family protein [Alicyclobacillaceae bacterium]MCL6497994.1 proline dehydrogenase family protein [Bacillota bacterium]
MLRTLILALGANPVLRAAARRYGLRLGARRFVAGEAWPEAAAVVRALNRDGIAATVDVLGEAMANPAEWDAARDRYLAVLAGIAAEGLDAHVSLKLTMFGLSAGPSEAEQHVRPVVAQAAAQGSFVRIDMEASEWTDLTLDLYRRLSFDYPAQVGVVLQAYLYRTRHDLDRLSDRPRNFRIVKGAYREPKDRAFPRKADVDRNYGALVKTALDRGHYVAIATHDASLITELEAWIRARGIGPDRYEFQMLYGIRYPLLQHLRARGHRCRVYVPFGRDWYPYFVRRMAERPANLWFVLRALAER